MKIAVNTPIVNVDGTEFKEPIVDQNGLKIGDSDKTVLFVDLIMTSMTTTLKEDVNESGEAMMKKWELAERAHKSRADVMDITIDEGTFIKERIRKTFASTVFYVNAHKIIEAAAGN